MQSLLSPCWLEEGLLCTEEERVVKRVDVFENVDMLRVVLWCSKLGSSCERMQLRGTREAVVEVRAEVE